MTIAHNLRLVAPHTPGAVRIIFARHGQYICNVHHVCNCDPTQPFFLTELGASQADALGERLKGEGIEHIVSSQFPRTRHTAARVNRHLNVPVHINRLANENRVGRAMEGRPAPEYFATIEHDPVHAFNDDGGESFADMAQRIVTLTEDIAEGTARTVLVTTHGWALQIVRVLRGDITAFEGATCVGMPTNCATEELYVLPPTDVAQRLEALQN